MKIGGILLRMLRQRAVATILTSLTIAAGVALVAVTLILREESERAFAQKEIGFEILVGAKGSPLQLVMNSLYNVGPPVGNIAYSFLDSIRADPRVGFALPMVTGDNVKGYRVIGVAPEFFSKFEFRRGENVLVGDGRAFTSDYEAVIGAEIAASGDIQLGDIVTMTHGIVDEASQSHSHGEVRICGVLEPTGTAIDRSVYTSLETVWDVHFVEYEEQRLAAEAAQAEFADELSEFEDSETTKETHEERPGAAGLDQDHSSHDHDHNHSGHDHSGHDHSGHDHSGHDHNHDHGDHDHSGHDHSGHDHSAHDHNHDHSGHDHDHDHGDHDHSHDHGHHAHHLHTAPGEKIAHEIPEIFQSMSSVAVKLNSPIHFESFIRHINEASVAQATMPVREIQGLFAIVGNVNGILLALSYLVIIIGALSIFVSIYNSLNERKREIAILRSLGARRGTIFSLIELEAMVIALVGSLLGLILAHVGLNMFVDELSARVGVNLKFDLFYSFELLLIGGVVVLAGIVACVPAWKAYRVDVAHNLAPIS